MNKKYYVEKPQLLPYEGMVVDKSTNFKYDNGKVHQTLKDLKFISIYTIKSDKYKTTTKVEIKLNEGEILLLEGENRGWILPAEQTPISSIDEAINDYKVLKEALLGDGNNDIEGNEIKNTIIN